MGPLWEFTGWVGAAAILSAYLAVSMNWLKTGSVFQIANLVGACAFIVNGAFHQAWPSVATNVAWFLISAIALLRMRFAGPSSLPIVDPPHIQFPGVPDSAGELRVIEVSNVPEERD
ncbi:CBU_0592 family membrane protein [Arthrobacter sp. 2RAF6]|uniref:CBU_0592 family membrane protein n=1 Tax=Arthrobacter sp. 2RAF6 TaxID=3233002 RepID=UPI003F8FF3F2